MTATVFQSTANGRCEPDLEHLGLGSQALGAQLHDGVGAEGVSDLVLAEGAQPHRQGALQLQRGDEDGLVTRVNTEGRERHRAGGEETLLGGDT